MHRPFTFIREDVSLGLLPQMGPTLSPASQSSRPRRPPAQNSARPSQTAWASSRSPMFPMGSMISVLNLNQENPPRRPPTPRTLSVGPPFLSAHSPFPTHSAHYRDKRRH